LSAPDGDALFNQRLHQTACLAKHLKDYNVGFADYRKAERIIESYDFDWGQYKTMAPLHLIIKDGKVHQLPQRNYNVLFFAEAMHDLANTVTYVDDVYPARNELNIYWEYA
jgi:hypothetical protein